MLHSSHRLPISELEGIHKGMDDDDDDYEMNTQADDSVYKQPF